MSEAGPYDAARRRSSVTTWCCRRPSDGTTRAASPMTRRDSMASAYNGKPPSSHNNSSSSDYHEAVASAGPIHWDNVFTLFGNDDDGHDKQVSKEAMPGTLEAATATATGGGEAPGVDIATNAVATTILNTVDCHPLQRPKPSRTLSSILSIRSDVAGDPNREESAPRPEGGEEEKHTGITDGTA